MQFLEKLDKGIDAFLKYFTGVLMVLLTVIVCTMVISRYVFRIQLGGIEELPVYFMCVCIWLGGVRVSRNDSHVKIEVIYSIIKNPRGQNILRMLTTLASALVLTYFCISAWQLVTRTYVAGTISSSIGFPLWIAYSFELIGTVGMTIYTYVNTVKYALRVVNRK